MSEPTIDEINRQFADALKTIHELTKERDEWETKFKTVTSQVCCIYCSAQYAMEDSAKLADHIMTCEKSPVVQTLKDALKRCDELAAKVATAEADREQLAVQLSKCGRDLSDCFDAIATSNAKVAAKDEALRKVIEFCDYDDPHGDLVTRMIRLRDEADHALSDQCGVGFVSPEKKKELENLHSHALLRIAKLVSREKVLVEALEHIWNYPVHSEPVGSAYDMQDIAKQALEACKI